MKPPWSTLLTSSNGAKSMMGATIVWEILNLRNKTQNKGLGFRDLIYHFKTCKQSNGYSLECIILLRLHLEVVHAKDQTYTNNLE
jgi:hypothetical protein